MLLLKDKNILLGVTGSIAAYKALELTRLFTKAGANVRVLMSEDAKRFVAPLSFESLTKNSVLHHKTESWANDNNHIFINKWTDIFVIAPATANTINKLSNGIADNLLTSTALACAKPVVVAPAANTVMFLHKTTQDSLKKLETLGYKIISSQNKLLACDDKGEGALANVETIFFECAKALLATDFWLNRDVLVTGGGTIEKIDDVRFISNFSSGKMAENLATALFIKGADVTSVQTKVQNQNLPIKRIFVESSSDMQKAINEESAKQNKKKTPFVFMAAAVSDYKPENTYKGKIKKENIGETFELKLVKTSDLIGSLEKNGAKLVGFKAELDKNKALDSAKNMLKNKNLNAVCLNVIDETNTFGSDENEITFISKNSETKLDKKSKLEISFEILECCEDI